MKVAGFIANRIAFNQQKSFSRFIIRLSIVATVISVMVMIVTLAFANGFQEKVSQKVFSFWGHMRIQERQPDKSIISEEIPIYKNDTLADEIRRNPLVKTIHPFATKYALLKTKDEIEGVMVKGFDSTYDFNNFKSFIKEGRPIQFNDSTYSREIMISAYTAAQLNLKVNDRVLIYFIRPGQSQEQQGLPNIRPDKLTITGIYKTGIEDYDKTFAIGDLKLIRKLNDWAPDEIGGYEIFLNDYKKTAEAVNDIYEMRDFPGTWDTKSTRDVAPNIFDWLNMQNTTTIVLIIIVVAVAIINLITCLIILVLERIKMIGILKSLGARTWTIQKIFLFHSVYITLTGIVLGTLAALGLLYLQAETGFIKLQEEAYYLDAAAVKIVWWQTGLVCLGTLVVSFLVLMIPTIIVKKIQPVKAIRFS